MAYVEAGLVAARRSLFRATAAGGTRPHRRGKAGAALGRGGQARRPGAGSGPAARYSAAGRADQPSRFADHRLAGGEARWPALRARPDQPRPPLPARPHARDRLARSRPHPASRQRLYATSRLGGTASWRRRNASGTRPTARSSPRSIGCVTASRAGASAMSSGWETSTRCGPSAASASRRPRR